MKAVRLFDRTQDYIPNRKIGLQILSTIGSRTFNKIIRDIYWQVELSYGFAKIDIEESILWAVNGIDN